jgi:hypothetical protein
MLEVDSPPSIFGLDSPSSILGRGRSAPSRTRRTFGAQRARNRGRANFRRDGLVLARMPSRRTHWVASVRGGARAPDVGLLPLGRSAPLRTCRTVGARCTLNRGRANFRREGLVLARMPPRRTCSVATSEVDLTADNRSVSLRFPVLSRQDPKLYGLDRTQSCTASAGLNVGVVWGEEVTVVSLHAGARRWRR